MQHSTASTAPLERPFSAIGAGRDAPVTPEDWRRPACTDACTVQRVLVAEAGFRGWRDLVSHDHTAYERQLEATVSGLAALLGQGVVATRLDPTAALLGMLLAGSHTTVRTGPLVVDLLSDTAELDGRPLLLGRTGWDILVLLARRLGEPVTYGELWSWLYPAAGLRGGRPPSLQPSRQAIRGLVARLRKQLGAHAALIVTVRADGVMLRKDVPLGGG